MPAHGARSRPQFKPLQLHPPTPFRVFEVDEVRLGKEAGRLHRLSRDEHESAGQGVKRPGVRKRLVPPLHPSTLAKPPTVPVDAGSTGTPELLRIIHGHHVRPDAAETASIPQLGLYRLNERVDCPGFNERVIIEEKQVRPRPLFKKVADNDVSAARAPEILGPAIRLDEIISGGGIGDPLVGPVVDQKDFVLHALRSGKRIETFQRARLLVRCQKAHKNTLGRCRNEGHTSERPPSSFTLAAQSGYYS